MSLPFEIEKIESEALWSGEGPEDSTYRYKLYHRFPSGLAVGEPPHKYVLFIMMNPSYASESQWDNTVRRCAGYAYEWGYSGLCVGNIFAYRTPFPKGGTDKHGKTWPPIWEAEDPIGPGNDVAILSMLSDVRTQKVVCAWGNAGQKLGRGKEVWSMIKSVGIEPTALKVNKSGEPAHPLYLPKDLTPSPYSRSDV